MPASTYTATFSTGRRNRRRGATMTHRHRNRFRYFLRLLLRSPQQAASARELELIEQISAKLTTAKPARA